MYSETAVLPLDGYGTPELPETAKPRRKAAEADYAEAIGVLREMEKKLISPDQWQRAIDAPDVYEALRYMGDDYGFAALRTPDAYEPLLQAKLAETYAQLFRMCAEPEAVEILNQKYIFHNLKVMVKASVSDYARANSDTLLSEVSAVPREVMSGGEKAGCPAYITHARQAMEYAYEQAAKDPQAIDMEADRCMFVKMLSLAESLDNEFILRYVRMCIDLYNLKLLMRVKNMQKGARFLNNALLPGGETGEDIFRDAYDKPFDVIAAKCYYKYYGEAVRQSEESYTKTHNYSTLEKLADNLLTRHIAQAKYIPFGPEPLFAYILARENEIRQIRIVITCKLNGIPEETLRERLRDLYA
jgi:V/A-type H+-transporting ATPase subunit C